jgi:uncharacterized protein YggE
MSSSSSLSRAHALTAAAVVALLSTIISCPTAPVIAAAPAPVAPPAALPRVIDVSGHARLDVPPDRVDLTLGLEQKRPTPRAAVAELVRKREQLIAGLRRQGIRSDDLVLSQVSLNPSYNHQAIDGYVAGVTLVATLHDSSRIGEVMEVAAGAGVTRISSATRTTQQVAMKKKVRELALRAAREKAEQIARTLGVRLGAVQAVRETQHESWSGSRWWSSGMENNVVSQQPPSVAESLVAPDWIQLHLGLSVTFAIQ